MKVIVSLSGGMDSATVLAEAIARGRKVHTVGFTYGSKHNQYENKAATAIAAHYGVPFKLIDLSGIMAGFKSDLLLSGGDIPEGHYEATSMSRTVVPGRNTIFAAILLGEAQSIGAEEIWLGIHAGDHAIYPDCRPEWLIAMGRVMWEASEGKVGPMTPFLKTNKVGILKRGLELRVPYQLTRTCYKDQPISCGRCGSCQERLEAFRLNQVEDPILYESREALAK